MRLGAPEGQRVFHELTPDGPVLVVRDASVVYRTGPLSLRRDRGIVAVDDVTLDVARGRSLGVVGESGCGKSSLARSIVDLAPLSSGQVSIGERSGIDDGWHRESKRLARSVQMIFQDPFSSLNPRKSVLAAVGEPLVVHRRCARPELRQRVIALLERVGMAESHAWQFPHQLSGGQRQRVCIARALAVEPSLLVCDEPTSALDVSIQAQVVEVFQQLQREEDVTYLFITHDLALLPQLTELVAVMYLGRIVEWGPVKEVLTDPLHPYTHALVASAPVLGRKRTVEARSRVLESEADREEPTSGCAFRPRCWLYRELDADAALRCVQEVPAQVRAATGSSRAAACHHRELARKGTQPTKRPRDAPVEFPGRSVDEPGRRH